MIYHSPSRMKTFNRCRRLYYLHYIEGWRESYKKPWLVDGTNIDNLLSIYDTRGFYSMLEQVDQLYKDPYKAINIKALLTHYHEKFGDKVLEPLTVDGKPGNQFEFKYKIEDKFSGFGINGFIDKVFDHDGYPSVLERKTTSSPINKTSAYWSDKEQDKQTVTYSLALSMAIDGPSNYVLWEVLRKPSKSIKGCAKVFNTDLDINDYEDAVFTWFQNPTQDMCARRGYWVTEDMREALLFDIASDDDEIANRTLNMNNILNNGYEGYNAWSRNFAACDDFGGCPYKDFCLGKCSVEQIDLVTKKENK